MNTSASKPSEYSLLLPWYVNGTLSADEQDAVEQHLQVCAECRETVAQLRAVAAAVDKAEPTPLVPEPPVAEFMEKSFKQRPPVQPARRVPFWSIAASLLAVIAASYWVVTSIPEANVFRTVTDPSGSAEIAYVFDIDTTAEESVESVRSAVAEAFAGGDIVQSDSGYRLTVSMPSATMKELNEFADVLRQIDGVQRVEIIGVQLPLE